MGPTALGAMFGSAAVAVGRGCAAAAGDGLSFAAELLKATGGAAETAVAGAVTGAEAASGLAARIQHLVGRIERKLADAGVALVQPLEIVGDGLGGLRVAGMHPQGDVVESILRQDLALERDFDGLNADCVAAGGQSLCITLRAD
jgi:hypothetical protein